MPYKIMKTEEEFTDNCICAYGILNYVDTINTDVRWWFDVSYCHDVDEKRYSTIFKSYITDEYKDYVLSIESNLINDKWEHRIFKKVDGLTSK
jgi:hypothetical protein